MSSNKSEMDQDSRLCQVVVDGPLRGDLEAWLSERGLHLYAIPWEGPEGLTVDYSDAPDLPTFGVGVDR